MNGLIKTILLQAEDVWNFYDAKTAFNDKYYRWIDEKYDRGYIIETLKIDCYTKDYDTNIYWDILYRAKLDPIHVEVTERLEIGL